MLDARRMEVYTAVFDADGKEVMPTCACVLEENSFQEWLGKGSVLFVGDGVEKFRSLVHHKAASFDTGFLPSADHMASLAEEAFRQERSEDVAYFEPFYLKDFVATTPRK